MKSKKITVTLNDIRSGMMPKLTPFPNRATYCPVARAINRAFKKGLGFTRVGPFEAHLGQDIRHPVARLNKKVRYWIHNFDRKPDRVNPFSFTLKY
jgi:hypothetical protein